MNNKNNTNGAMMEYYLKATYQKSYYKKAKVFMDDDFIVLRSYDTDVIAIDREKNKIIRLWNGWSKTTSIHINDFLKQNGFSTLNKKEWLAMECINPEPVYNMYYSTGFYTHKSNILLTEQEAEQEYNRISENNPRLTVWYE